MTDAEETNVVDILEKEVAKDLLDKMQGLYALAKTHQILQNGSYRLSLVDDVNQALIFLSTLHGNLMAEALSHPDSDKVPKLVEVKKQREVEAAKEEKPHVASAEEKTES